MAGSPCLFCEGVDTDSNPHVARADKPEIRICLQCAEQAWWAATQQANPDLVAMLQKRRILR